MVIVENEFTINVQEICVLKDNRIVIRQINGVMSLWDYSRPKQLQYVRRYENTGNFILKIIPFSMETFISFTSRFGTKIWEIDSGKWKKMEFKGGGYIHHFLDAVVLPNNLLVVSGDFCPEYGGFVVYDLESGKCIYDLGEQNRTGSITLDTTADGLLVVNQTRQSWLSIWKITRTECKHISQVKIKTTGKMKVLPTGEIVVASDILCFYRISPKGEIYLCKTLYGKEKFTTWEDTIYPLVGYKVIRGFGMNENLELWNCISEEREKHVVKSFEKDEQFILRKYNVLEKKGAVIVWTPNDFLSKTIEIHEFSENIFRFPRQLAEVRKNARVLSQAQRSASCLFNKLPENVILKIVSFTFDSKDEHEIAIKEDVIRNYFCRPMNCEVEYDYLYDCYKPEYLR